jgi:DNA (cytosine-5)-methyltransferase 1
VRPEQTGGHRLIDLFAGIGGMTCGFVQARRAFTPVFAVEIDADAASIYEANFGDHIHVGDIADVSVFPKADVVIGVSLARRNRREIPAS